MQALVHKKTVMLEATTDANLKKPLLLRGFQGGVVVELQKLLTYRDSYTGSLNGIFDTPLENAVKAFQHKVFLEEDGVVGQLTWQALYSGMPVNMPLLKRGSFGQNVVRLQETLRASRIYSARIDGIFGRLTEVSVQGFQKRWGLVADGVVGSHTWLALSKVPH